MCLAALWVCFRLFLVYLVCMRIVLLSDTHGFLDPALWNCCIESDEVWHAGDIGPLSLLEQLHQKPLVAVYGNTDDTAVRSQCPEEVVFERGGVTVWITHIGAAPPSYTPEIREALALHRPDIFVCGHTHILRIERDKKGCLYLNPGAAGHRGHHKMRTAVRFSIRDRQLQEMEVIELGPRGQQSRKP